MNVAVRVAEGVDGPIILAAWCVTCGQEAMPMNDGRCGWCDRRIVGPPDAKAPRSKAKPKLRPVITEADIAQALRNEAARIGRNPYSREWQDNNRRPSAKTIFRRFGSWSAALEAAGLA